MTVLGLGTATELKGEPSAVHVFDALEISPDTTDTGHSESERSQWAGNLEDGVHCVCRVWWGGGWKDRSFLNQAVSDFC